MDDITKKIIEENCILEVNKMKEQHCSEVYIQGYIRAYVDGFSEGSIYGEKDKKYNRKGID